ncbi:ribosome maturation factor RimP [Sinomonas atrocyanea]|uniref:ribosome maturation factor RimP n=1 Tax=Sinomonas atrocyanea TaxID=37927 RepID=UPI0027800DA8|nr:ribosome maturation factor RimP [Sinomonas atrocyanea]MDP9883511.1 ribosome maturation factor RimP [Sinomonas atrocyanea]
MSEPDLPSRGAPTPAEQDPHAGGEEARLHALLEPIVQARQLVLEGISVKAAGKHRTVGVVVDLQDDETGGVSLDVIAELSRELSDALDAAPEADTRPYDLEVSSPGVSRPLTQLRHWRRALGRLVRVNVIGEENITGRLREVTEDGIVLVPDLPAKKGVKPKPGAPIELAFDAIRSGKVEVEFSHLEDAELGPADAAGPDNDDTDETEEA